MRYISLFIFLAFFLFSFSACVKSQPDINSSSTTETTTENQTVETQDASDFVSDATVKQETTEETVTKKSESNSSAESTTESTTLSDLEDLKNTEAVTYYSVNPNNKYICAVAKKYGEEKSNLVALIRVNAQNPGATVLQFSGKTDENGELLKTKEELKYVYEVNDETGEIRKASGKMSDNDGYSFVESVTIFQLIKEFILPYIDDATEYPE